MDSRPNELEPATESILHLNCFEEANFVLGTDSTLDFKLFFKEDTSLLSTTVFTVGFVLFTNKEAKYVLFTTVSTVGFVLFTKLLSVDIVLTGFVSEMTSLLQEQTCSQTDSIT